MAKQDNMNSGKRAGGVRHIFAVIGKIVGTILLTAFLTALIFACLFAVYVKKRSVRAGAVGLRQLFHGADLRHLL